MASYLRVNILLVITHRLTHNRAENDQHKHPTAESCLVSVRKLSEITSVSATFISQIPLRLEFVCHGLYWMNLNKKLLKAISEEVKASVL